MPLFRMIGDQSPSGLQPGTITFNGYWNGTGDDTITMGPTNFHIVASCRVTATGITSGNISSLTPASNTARNPTTGTTYWTVQSGTFTYTPDARSAENLFYGWIYHDGDVHEFNDYDAYMAYYNKNGFTFLEDA